MRTLTRILLASCSGALAGLAPAVARAQNDISPHLPNVLLLLDSSGSMEYLVDTVGGVPVTPETSGNPDAACSLSGTTTVMTRWASLVSVLTGSFQTGAFGCETLMRTENKFVAEFNLPGTTYPYDYKYFLPWHRIYSNGCTIGALQPMNVNQDWTNWPANPYDFHNSTDTCALNSGNCCNWSGQNNDGVLDTFAGLARFGLMTLDSFPDPSTGSSLAPATQIDGPGALRGMWSYFHNWQSTTSPATPAAPSGQPNTNRPAAGNPNACATPGYMEVGARNPAAPPWEGPMVPFGDPISDSSVGATNTKIQLEILSMRPYGATPLAGLLDDANEFLFNDQSLMPGQNGPHAIAFGPSGPNPDGTLGDPLWKNGCRKTFVILLTDGGANLDLRGATGQCNATPADWNHPGHCPYLPADQILTNMRTGLPQQSVTTYVVGFAMSNPTALAPTGKASCADLTPTDCSVPPNNLPPPGLEDCCELQKLAVAGAWPNDPVFLPATTPYAFFADNPTALKSVLSQILSQGVGNATARTAPVYQPAGPANAQGSNFVPPGGNPALSYHFIASFNVTAAATGNLAQSGGANGMWSGNLKRERYTCVSGAPTAQSIDATHGDDYAHNLDIATVASRNFFTVIGTTNGNDIYSDNTIRPNLGSDDGFGTYGASPPQTPLTSGATFPATMSGSPAAFGVKNGNDANCQNAFSVHNNPSLCVQYAVNWEIGGTNSDLGSNVPTRDPNSSSTYCSAIPGRKCSKLGAIYHSTPAVAAPPREFLRDDTYTAYANDPTYSIQPIMLYTATIDGQLHAFKVSSSVSTDTLTTDRDSNNNELWSFFPPAVLQHILPNYNSAASNLLDGAPVIADVPAISAVGTLPPKFERTAAVGPLWHRVLVAGGGPAGGFYYALDITDPTHPTFLWQISTDAQGHPLFGAQTPTPAITIVAIDQGSGRTQVPVAILPGGTGTLASDCDNPPTQASASHIKLNDPLGLNPSNKNGSVWNITGGYNPPNLRCWSNQQNNQGNQGQGNFNNGTSATGNSLTVVRLDTGSVLAHFTGAGYFGGIGNGQQADPGDHSHTTNVFTTQPFTAPLTGVPVAYPSQTGQVADRVYIGDADGQLWRLDVSNPDLTQWSVSLAWDAYLDANNSQRDGLNLPPVVSTDPVGNVVILIATGDQNMLTATSSHQRVWSITETPLDHNTSQNWMKAWSPGLGHVTGPMAVFNSILYFATYTPQPSNVCSPGVADLWGVDYRRPNPNGTGVPLPGLTNPVGSYTHAALDGSIIFGVSTTELPSCGSPQTTTDPYFGSHSTVTGVAQSEYRIMWQTGAGNGVSGNGVRAEGTVQSMQNMTVPSPGQSTRIDAWTAIIE
jgi:type IV pilus assembly protein PilY1